MIYPLKNLSTSILRAFKKFLAEVGTKPTLIQTDFDSKPMGAEISEYLNDKNIRIISAPPKRQHQNGLVEQNWKSIVNMAHNWLRSSLLPSKYWWFAVKRASEIANILPTKFSSTISTTHQQVHNQKVDYCQLFPMFSTAYIKQDNKSGGMHKSKFATQSLKTICVGTCPQSDSLLFYHPPSKQLLSCADSYYFDNFAPAGPTFGETYDGSFTWNTKSSLSTIHLPPTHQQSDTIYIQSSSDPTKHHKATVLSTPHNEDDDKYVVQILQTGEIREVEPETIKDHDPSTTPTDSEQPLNCLLLWIHHNAKVTIILQRHFTTPKQGHLHHKTTSNTWSFIPGRHKSKEPIPLPDFYIHAQSMVTKKKLFKGLINTTRALTARRSMETSNILSHLIVSRIVSATSLHNPQAPTSLLKHAHLHSSDRKTWDASYREEYDGLMNLDTWEVIDEKTYQLLKKKVGKIIPTMAISTIKHDKFGKPHQAKYRIVVLGNLDPHHWDKHDCLAPVLSQFEFCLLISLAAHLNCVPKGGDVSQAFCQSFLPNDEIYVCSPPPTVVP